MITLKNLTLSKLSAEKVIILYIMMMRKINKVKGLFISKFGTLFFKLWGVHIATISLFFALVFYTLGSLTHEEPLYQISLKLVDYLLKDINTPPDPKKLQKIVKKLNILIIVTHSNNIYWKPKSYDNHHNLSQLIKIINPKEKFSITSVNFKPVAIYYKNDYSYFLLDFVAPPSFKSISSIFISLIMMIIILIVEGILISRLFQPLKKLKKDAYKICSGDLTYRPITEKTDEIGSIANSVNIMANNLFSIIESKEELILSIAHELKGPLTKAKLRIGLIADKENREKLDKDLNELNSLVDILLYSEACSSLLIEKEPININILIKDIIGENKNNNIKTRLCKEICLIEGNIVSLRLLISNIVSNSLRHCSSEVIISLKKLKNNISISFSDDGGGVKERELKKLIEPFYRADHSRQRKTGGYGLGLYLCKKIVTSHNGKLEINNIENGLCVTVYIPFLNEAVLTKNLPKW